MPIKKQRKFDPWSEAELAVIREHYPKGGSKAVAANLSTRRTTEAIRRRAQLIGVKPGGFLKYRDLPDAEFVDAAIRRAVLSGKKGEVKKLEKTTGRSYGWLKWRAMKLGLTPEKERTNWTPEEEALLESLAGRSAETIARVFKGKGYKRSAKAIYVKIYKMGLDNSDPDTHTASDLARLFGVSQNVVTRWLNKGWIKAERGRLSPRDSEPVFWRIKRDEVRKFVRDYPGQVPMRTADPYWLIELLAGPPKGPQAKNYGDYAHREGEGANA